MSFLVKFIFTALLFCYGCRDVSENSQLDISFDLSKSYAWFNLMPGSKHSFHFTLQGSVQNNEKEDIDSIQVLASILQGNKLLFEIKPEIIPLSNSGYLIKSTAYSMFEIKGRNEGGINKIDPDSTISIRLQFIALTKLSKIVIDSIKIDKAY